MPRPRTSGSEAEPPPPPPPPPSVRAPDPTSGQPDGQVRPPAERPSRRPLVLGVIAALVVIAVPVGLALAAALSTPSQDDARSPSAEDSSDDPSPPSDQGDPEPVPPDIEALSGRDAVLADLLSHVDESEQAMMAFQRELGEVLGAPDRQRPELLAEIRTVAQAGAMALEEIRPELTGTLGEGELDEVRVAYLAHHDAWADYLDALAEDPSILATETSGSRWQLSINLTAEAFARELREVVDGDVDEAVRSYADDILQRGFERDDVVPDA